MIDLGSVVGSAWFQILYPAFWFVLGESLGRLGNARATALARGVVQPVSLVSAVVVHHRSDAAASGGGSNGGSTDDPWLLLILGFAVSIGLAWAYLQYRDIALGISIGLVSVALGAVVGTIRSRMSLGLFDGDWRVAVVGVVLAAMAAVLCAVTLLHPPAAPPAYEVMFDAYREEGLDALASLDTYTWMFAYQGLAALALVFSGALLLLTVVGMVARGSILAGSRPTLTRRWLARFAQTRGRLLGVVGMIVLLDVIAFVFGAGYANRWRMQDTRPETPRLLVADVALSGKSLSATAVATAAGFMTITVRVPGTSRPRLRRTVRVAPGWVRFRAAVPGRRPARARVTLTSGRRGRRGGTTLVYRCRAGRCLMPGGTSSTAQRGVWR